MSLGDCTGLSLNGAHTLHGGVYQGAFKQVQMDSRNVAVTMYGVRLSL